MGEENILENLMFDQDLTVDDAKVQLGEQLGIDDAQLDEKIPQLKGFKGTVRFVNVPNTQPNPAVIPSQQFNIILKDENGKESPPITIMPPQEGQESFTVQANQETEQAAPDQAQATTSPDDPLSDGQFVNQPNKPPEVIIHADPREQQIHEMVEKAIAASGEAADEVRKHYMALDKATAKEVRKEADKKGNPNAVRAARIKVQEIDLFEKHAQQKYGELKKAWKEERIKGSDLKTIFEDDTNFPIDRAAAEGLFEDLKTASKNSYNGAEGDFDRSKIPENF